MILKNNYELFHLVIYLFSNLDQLFEELFLVNLSKTRPERIVFAVEEEEVESVPYFVYKLNVKVHIATVVCAIVVQVVHVVQCYIQTCGT